MLTVNTLRARCHNGEHFDYLLFWGHQPDPAGRVTQSCLSQFYLASFEVNGDHYPTAEHWMMASKARLFADQDALQRIMLEHRPEKAKAIGRQVKHFVQDTWTKNARRIVTEGNYAKFSQNEALKNFLLSTGDKVIVEASPTDNIWGIGMAAKDPDARDPQKWKGQNLLGFALMDVREQLKQGTVS